MSNLVNIVHLVALIHISIQTVPTDRSTAILVALAGLNL